MRKVLPPHLRHVWQPAERMVAERCPKCGVLRRSTMDTGKNRWAYSSDEGRTWAHGRPDCVSAKK